MISIASRSVLAGLTWAAGRARGRSARVAPSRTSSPSIQPRNTSSSITPTHDARWAAIASRASSARGGHLHHRPALAAQVGHVGQAQALAGAVRRRRTAPRTRRPGPARISSGGAYCSTMPPTLSRAIRSPSLIASSMSWVTITIVLCTRSCRSQQLVLEAGPHDGVDRAEGLVHQQHRRVGGQGAGHAHALLLAARQLVGVAARASRGRAPPAPPARRCAPRVRSRVPAQRLGHGGDVLGDGAVGEQAHLLDHVADAAPQRGQRLARDVAPLDLDRARGGLDEAVDHAQRGGLAAARGPDQGDDRPARDVQAQRRDGIVIRSAEALRDLAQPDRRARGIRWGELRWGGQGLHGERTLPTM